MVSSILALLLFDISNYLYMSLLIHMGNLHRVQHESVDDGSYNLSVILGSLGRGLAVPLSWKDCSAMRIT
jgi:hypothetical protein